MLYQWPGKAIYHNGLPFEEDFDGLVEVSSDWKGKNGRETHDSYACMEEFLQLYIPLKPIFAILWSFNIAIENGVSYIVSCPSKNGDLSHSYVSLPEGVFAGCQRRKQLGTWLCGDGENGRCSGLIWKDGWGSRGFDSFQCKILQGCSSHESSKTPFPSSKP